ncbi:MAG: hypothetical protein J1E29_04700, partial [Duncaniella sp.]|nr:hypothetical protein [Duncaniella sp.]
MTPFLQLVAQVYLENERRDMMDYCFVFPNKRSGVFFRHYLISLSQGQPLILPAISTIGELTGQFTDLVEASRFEQLFTLYNEYRALNGDVADFDRFMFWGEMILSDFNDVDRDLVDPDKLFINLKRYREVSANYLTEEQQEILSRYWGESFDRYSPDEFWTHLHTDNPSELEKHFLQLWEVLSPLYGRFTTTLRSRGVGTQGMMMRDAIEKLRIVETSELQYRRYIFVGFSMLSLSEFRIFDNLKQRGVADFYWDDASPALKTIGNKVVAFMRRNRDNFPSRHSLPDEEIRMPEVKVTGIPSAIGQTKKAGEQLQKWVKQEVVDPQNAISTAVVLPDESLLIPMIHSVPEEITSLNVTMGLPLRSTAFASFVNAVITMQLRSYRTADGIHKFFHDDVKTLLSFPMLRRIDPSGSVRIMHLITDNRLYMVPTSRIAEEAPELMFVFTPIADSESIEATYGYFNTLFTTLQSLLPKAESDDKKDAGDSVITSNDVEAYYIESYIDALNDLRGALVRFSVDMHDTTFIRLLQKATAGITVSLAGKPLTGLQLMGVLETRALDFENIIILSMNERVFPRKHYTRSFIPDSLRRAYGMATADKQEAIYAYYFYRLISRASNVTLLYDAR